MRYTNSLTPSPTAAINRVVPCMFHAPVNLARLPRKTRNPPSSLVSSRSPPVVPMLTSCRLLRVEVLALLLLCNRASELRPGEPGRGYRRFLVKHQVWDGGTMKSSESSLGAYPSYQSNAGGPQDICQEHG